MKKKALLFGGTSEAYRDHRIAMALSGAAFGAASPVTVTGAECIRKSYPAFFRDMETLGGTIEYEHELR